MSDSNVPSGRRRPHWPRPAPKCRCPSVRDDPVILELDAPNPSQALDLEWDEAARTLPLVRHDQDLEVTIARVWPFNLHEEDMVTTGIPLVWRTVIPPINVLTILPNLSAIFFFTQVDLATRHPPADVQVSH